MFNQSTVCAVSKVCGVFSNKESVSDKFATWEQASCGDVSLFMGSHGMFYKQC